MVTPAPLALRPYTPSDHDFIIDLSQRAFGEYARFPVAQISSALKESGTNAIVACAPECVGFAIVRTGSDVAYIQAIAVLESHRGQGIGRALLRAAEGAARRRGAGSVELATSQANLGALELFLHAGYVIRSRQSRYYERGQDAVLMTKQL